MQRKVGSILLCAFIFSAIFVIEVNNDANAQVTEEWVRIYNGPGDYNDQAVAIALDPSGNIYVTGTINDDVTGLDYGTIKYDPSGNEQWIAKYNGPGNNNDEARDIAVGPSGYIYVTGHSVSNQTSYDYATIKYDSNGNQIWVARYNGPGNGYDDAFDLTLDSSENVYITGRSYFNSGTQCATVKYDSNGNELWSATFDSPGNYVDDGHAVAVDLVGNVYVTGWTSGYGTKYDIITIKYDAFGNEIWVSRYNGPGNDWDRGCDVAVTPSGNVIVTGYRRDIGPNNYDYITIAYDSLGNDLWMAIYNGPGNDTDQALDMALDSSGNIYVTGRSIGNGSGYDLATIKYGPYGNEDWVARYNSPGDLSEEAWALDLDSSGNVYVTGHVWEMVTSWDYITVAYDNSGNELWAARYNGPGNGPDWARDICVDSSYNVYVTGWVEGIEFDYATVKYSQDLLIQTPIADAGLDQTVNEGDIVQFDGSNSKGSTSGAGQVWTKYVGNPVLDTGPSGSWDDAYVTHPSVLYDGTTYQMWYSGYDRSNWRIGYAHSSDGITWIKNPSNPLIDMGASGSWDDTHVTHPIVLYDGTKYHMWYSGQDGWTYRIGYASSSDGITWVKSSGNPVLDCGPSGSWDDTHVTHPTVLYDGTKYHMWYTGHDGSNYRIGYAYSSDGTTWFKSAANPVLNLGSSGSWDDFHVYGPSIIYDGITYSMWYSGHDGSNYRIGYATSSDGITWTKDGSNPMLDIGPPGSWEDVGIISPTVLFIGGSYHMWYRGFNGTNVRIGYAYTSAGGQAQIVSYDWDFDSDVDSDGDGDPTNDIDATGSKPTHIYGDDGIYTVTLKVTDNQSLSDTDTCIVIVNNLAPTIKPIGPFIIDEDFPFPFNGNATDPGSDDLTFTWSWGDWTSETTTVYYNDGIGSDPYPSPWGTFPFSVNETVQHAYKNYGDYTLNLKVEDDDGGVALYKTNVTVIGLPPPTLHINTSPDGKDSILYWDPPPAQGIDHYLIYRSTSQIGFDFNKVWKNTLIDKEPGEPNPIPLRTMWNDTNAAFPGNVTNYEEQYYYVIRAVNIFGKKSYSSRTVGKWTKTYPQEISTFSLPFQPLQNLTIDQCLRKMNAKYIKWMHPGLHKWMKHGDGALNDSLMKVGEGYEVKFDIQTNCTFTGMPGAMIMYDDISFGFDSTPGSGNADSLSAMVDSGGNVTLSWKIPMSMNPDDSFQILRSTKRDGFWGFIDVDYEHIGTINISSPGGMAALFDKGIAKAGKEFYYMIIPINSSSGERGVSSYSRGIWTEEYHSGYDTFGIPLKLNNNHTADWYCDNIPDTVGINYFIINEQRWCWHSSRMPARAYDPLLIMTQGYQISTSNTTKFTFIGV